MNEQQMALAVLPPITEFSGEWRFLSNFYAHGALPVPDCWGSKWPEQSPESYVPRTWWEERVPVGPVTVEHAFQAAKAARREDALPILAASSPGAAKQLGKVVALREDWEQVKVPIMLACLRAKFAAGSSLGLSLMHTSPRALVEGNTWGDTFWGAVADGSGKNMLGKLLMLVRAELVVASTVQLASEALR